MNKKLVEKNTFVMVFGFNYPVVYHYKNKYIRKTYALQKPNQNFTTHK